jgi:hypothetical protein
MPQASQLAVLLLVVGGAWAGPSAYLAAAVSSARQNRLGARIGRKDAAAPLLQCHLRGTRSAREVSGWSAPPGRQPYAADETGELPNPAGEGVGFGVVVDGDPAFPLAGTLAQAGSSRAASSANGACSPPAKLRRSASTSRNTLSNPGRCEPTPHSRSRRASGETPKSSRRRSARVFTA